MNFRQSRKQDVDINVTSLIDVVFLLLIFFMASTTFEKRSQIELTLPEANPEAKSDAVDQIKVAIDRKGDIYVNEQALVNTQLETVRQALAAARPAGGAEPVLVISADAGADYQTVVDVMDAARQAGLYRITFPTRRRAAP